MAHRAVEKGVEEQASRYSHEHRRISFGGNYRSRSEQIIAKSFDRQGISFRYEPGVLVEDSQGHERLWHPDFQLPDHDILLEYVGLPHDEQYMHGIQKKKNAYERMGKKVVWLTPEDVWEFDRNGKCVGVREDVDAVIASKISMRGQYSRGLEDAVDSPNSVLSRRTGQILGQKSRIGAEAA